MEQLKTIMERVITNIRLRWLERQIKDRFDPELSLRIDKAIKRYDE